jgi:hypothetical protein
MTVGTAMWVAGLVMIVAAPLVLMLVLAWATVMAAYEMMGEGRPIDAVCMLAVALVIFLLLGGYVLVRMGY